MGCLFGKPKTDIWNDEVQGFYNLAIDEKEVSGRTSQTFDFKKAANRRRRYSSEHSGIWMNLDKHIYLGRDTRGTQTKVDTMSQMVQTEQVWRMYDDRATQTIEDGDVSSDENESIKQGSDVCENESLNATCEIQTKEIEIQNGKECEIQNRTESEVQNGNDLLVTRCGSLEENTNKQEYNLTLTGQDTSTSHESKVIAKECNGNVMDDSQQTNENHITEQNEADIVVKENSYM